MSDLLLDLGKNPRARALVRSLGLPIPLPQPLKRERGPVSARPLADKRVVVSATPGAELVSELATTLAAAGADAYLALSEPQTAVFRDPGETFGRPTRPLSALAERTPASAIVFDATGAKDVDSLHAVYAFFHSVIARIEKCGRVLVLARDAAGLSAEGAAVQSALEGFVRSMAKEIGRTGATANLVIVERGAERRLAPVLRYALSPRSAFVTAQPIVVSTRARALEEPPIVRSLEKKIALVTGAARGIGEATARALAAEGALVVCLDRPADDGPVSQLARSIGGRALLVDVTDPGASDAIVAHLKSLGGVDVVVHNAGITRDKTLARMDEKQWDSVLDVNLRAVLTMTKAIEPSLRDNGRLICLSSIAGLAGNVGQTAYAASKSGIVGFVRAESERLAGRGITVNAVAPGFIETRLTAAIPVAIREVARRLSALGQGGLPEDIADAITFLATPGAQGITGRTLRVCGGAFIGALAGIRRSRRRSVLFVAMSHRSLLMSHPSRRAVVVAGARTPFVKAFTDFTKLDTIALGVAAVAGLLKKTGLAHRDIESIVWGGVILPSGSPNVAREIALDLRLDPSCEGMTVTRACASGLQAITLAAAAIERGEADVIVAGGSDSTSNAEIKLPQKVVHALAPLALGKPTPADFLGVLAQLAPFTDVLPKTPRIAERSTGEVMGEAAERMARRNEISREAQDAFAVRSHQRAAAAIAAGRFDDEIVPVETPDGRWVHADGLVRADTSVEKLAKLRPAFAKDGTLTAGNSSALTDGAAAVVLMSEERAKSLGLTPLAAITSWAYSGVDPSDQLLMGPALAMPKALDRAGLKLADIDLVDMHEAFAAQVLSVLKMLGSAPFARARLGRDEAFGAIDPEKLNVHGGSLALGHPFGATGARMVTTMANELARTGKKRALLGICAAGGLGAAAVLERVLVRSNHNLGIHRKIGRQEELFPSSLLPVNI
jgi:acetyl-CoA acyltransferase